MTSARWLALAVLAMPSTAAATCILNTSSNQKQNAFLVTVTSASIASDDAELKSGEPYRVEYKYSVVSVQRGASRPDIVLYSMHSYDKPSDGLDIDDAEAVFIRPGDSVLVLVDEEAESMISICGPTRPWTDRVSR